MTTLFLGDFIKCYGASSPLFFNVTFLLSSHGCYISSTRKRWLGVQSTVGMWANVNIPYKVINPKRFAACPAFGCWIGSRFCFAVASWPLSLFGALKRMLTMRQSYMPLSTPSVFLKTLISCLDRMFRLPMSENSSMLSNGTTPAATTACSQKVAL